MKVLFATTNPSKLAKYKGELESRGIDLITLNDIDVSLDIEETGKNAIENAYIKAKSYYDATGLPTIGMDDNLFIEELPQELQPGTHVRRVGGKELTDDEMIEHYTKLVRDYGGKLTCKWVCGMVIFTDKGEFEYTWSKDNFYFVETPSKVRKPRYPLDSISINPIVNKYCSEMTPDDKKVVKEKVGSSGVIEFMLNSLLGEK